MRALQAALFLLLASQLALASDESLNRSLRSEARLGRLARLEELVHSGAEVDGQAEFGETALFYAIQFGHVPAMKRLLLLGANPNIKDEAGRSPLMKASENCNDNAVDALLHAGAQVNQADLRGRTSLMNAAESGCPRVVALILSQRREQVDLDMQDHRFKTAEDYAQHPWVEELFKIARNIQNPTPKKPNTLPPVMP